MEQAPLRLTQTVQKGGCAAKVAAAELRGILAQLNVPPAPKELLVGNGTFDDAAIYKVTDSIALVQTLDFFTPIVDTPKYFGRIAAANALSDVYAMGGRPATAMAILAFPLIQLPTSVAVEVLQGAIDVIRESGAHLVGGHTIDDDTLKFGLSVTGFVHPDKVWSNDRAQNGDLLILTKPLGTGALTAALKKGVVTELEIQDGIDSMCLLNDVTAQLSEELTQAIHGATDVTGFGLAGHAFNMAKASDVTCEFDSENLPRFERALPLIREGHLTKANRTNLEYVAASLEFKSVVPELRQLVVDPQTNGGMLMSVRQDKAQEICQKLRQKFPVTKIIGRVTAKGPHHLRFL